MCNEKVAEVYSTQVSDSFDKMDDNFSYEIAFRRWLVREIEEGRTSVSDAIKTYNFNPKNGAALIYTWRQKYAPEMVLALEDMTAEEKQKLAALQERNKQLEKQLEDARLKNIALDLLIDIAEEKLKISIRKKPGAKQ
jgi:transposase-like protein